MDFAEVENEYRELKELYDAGMLTLDTFRQRLEELRLVDEQGRSWMIGYKSGQWYQYDGTQWVRGTPAGKARLEEPVEPVSSPALSSTEQTTPLPVTEERVPSRPADGASPGRAQSRGLWPALIGLVVVGALAAGAYLILSRNQAAQSPGVPLPSLTQAGAPGLTPATESASSTEIPPTDSAFQNPAANDAAASAAADTAENAGTEVEVARVTDVHPEGVIGAGIARATRGDLPILNRDVSGTVQFWHFWASPVRRQAVRRVVAVCKQQLPNIEVIETAKPFGDLWTENHVAVAAGVGMPDVIVSDRPPLALEAADGTYMNLQELATRDNVTREQFYDWAWDQTLYEGNTHGIPFETDVRVLFWNKTLFQQAGLDPDKPPATWDELQAYADKLDKIGPDGGPQRVGFFPLWSIGPTIWAYTNDADPISPEGQPQINDPKMVEVIDWIKGWVDRYGGWTNILDFQNQFGGAPNDLFMSGAAAMIADIYGYNSQLSFYRPQIELDNGETVRMEWGIAPLPYKAGPGSWSGGFSLSIPTGAANAEAAWEFIKCTTGPWGQSSWARDTQAQPTNLQAASDPVLQADPSWQVAADALKTSTGGVFVAGYPNWGEQLSQRWDKVWLGELSPQRAMDEAQQAVIAGLGE